MSWARRLTRHGVALGCLASLTAFSPGASAQRPARPAAQREKSPSLLSELGAPAAEKLLASDESSDRLRALARLSALGTPRAIELLSKALDPGGAARGAEEHLAAVRALAPHAGLPAAREALVRAMSSPPVDAEAGPLSDWVRSAAALALARTQDPAALAALGRALRKPGHAAELARDALSASPPRDIATLLKVPGAPTKDLCEALGLLGDKRAEGFLRDVVRRAAPDARAAAALALLRLGSSEVVELSRHWLRSERQPALLVAAARILIERDAAEAGESLQRLFELETTREQALPLLLSSRGAVAPPQGLTLAGAGREQGPLLELMVRGAASWGAAPLEQALLQQQTAGLACYALSRVPGPWARSRLERALKAPALRAFALRALALRQLRLGESSDAAASLAESLRRSKLPAERAASAFARAALSSEALLELLASNDAVELRAAARLAVSGAAARLAATRLTRESEPALRAALSVALVDPSAAELVPTPLLLQLIHDAAPGALLAATTLAARKDADLLPLIRELLASGDPWLRAHTLLGLSRARDADALGLIENAYRFEPDPRVRHAAIVALSRRPEAVKARGLRLAAELDAAAEVRQAAELGLAGHALGDGVLGPETVWLELAKNPGLDAQALPAAELRLGSGLALPVVADPDGVVVLAGVDPAAVEVRLALLSDRVNVVGARP